MKKLKELGGGTMGVPVNRKLNFAPSIEVKTPEEVKSKTDEIRKMAGSEGVVAKQINSPYRLDFTTRDDWVKYHNNTLIRAKVIKANRTKGGVWTYTYGVKPGEQKAEQLTNNRISPVGETFATKRKFNTGDKILIEGETVNKIVGPDGVRMTVWVPRVLGPYQEATDTIDDAVNRAAKELVLRVKKTDEKGKVVEYLPANIKKQKLVPQVPTFGPKNAVIAFVGASPGRVEAARKEPFTGPGGETFNKVYLEPLGLKRSQVLLTNAVPRFLSDEQGRAREPTVEEIKDWREWLKSELEEKQPKIIVALGRTAESALGERRDFVLPHPSAVRRFGDTGEVKRKLKQISAKLKIEKQLPKPMIKPREEGGTRSTRAYENWEKNWAKMLPKKGKGEFIYQHHWRGLDKDETRLSDDQLMKSKHSIHGDLRLEGDDGLWGFAVFLGRTEDNKDKKLNDKLIDWKTGDNIELAPKLLQPKEWLNVGIRKPLITDPGEVGATAEKHSKFFALDKGTYELGVARKHMVEIFLDSKHLNGKYLIMFAPVAGRRRWLIDKPEDQKPMAERRDLADVLSELRRKNQKHLFWGMPGGPHEKYDVRTGRVVKEGEVIEIAKANQIKQIVYGVVLDPYGLDGKPDTDAHDDWMPPDQTEKTAHGYLKESRIVGLQHSKKADAQVVESWVEPYPTTQEYQKAMRGEAHKITRRKFGDDFLHSGSWVLGVQLGDREWELYKAGKINAFSPGGYGIRKPLVPSRMPTVTVIDLIERQAS
jgi:uracil-DNA glycosylase family 4